VKASERTTKNVADERFSSSVQRSTCTVLLLRCPDRKATITRQWYILSRLHRRISTHIFGTLNAPTTCNFFVRALKKRPKRLFSYRYILGGHPPGQNTRGSVVPPTLYDFPRSKSVFLIPRDTVVSLSVLLSSRNRLYRHHLYVIPRSGRGTDSWIGSPVGNSPITHQTHTN
jgi:hypothetical protein